MTKDPKYKVIAEAVRLEIVESTDDFFIVFKVVDEQFKKKIKDNWLDNIEVELLDKKLVEKE